MARKMREYGNTMEYSFPNRKSIDFCKWRKQGCRDGADCPNCHYCKWQRRPKDEVSTPNPPPVVASQVSQSLEAMAIPPPPGLTPMEPEETHTTQEKLGCKSLCDDCGCFIRVTSRRLYRQQLQNMGQTTFRN